jgi:predicted transcriptional regulator
MINYPALVAARHILQILLYIYSSSKRYTGQDLRIGQIMRNMLFHNLRWENLKSRGSTEIIGLILQSVENEPLTRSKIMYHAILNFKQVSDYAAYLTEAGLLSYSTKDRKYSITERGKQFLALFKETNSLLTTPYDCIVTFNNEQQKQEVALHK